MVVVGSGSGGGMMAAQLAKAGNTYYLPFFVLFGGVDTAKIDKTSLMTESIFDTNIYSFTAFAFLLDIVVMCMYEYYMVKHRSERGGARKGRFLPRGGVQDLEGKRGLPAHLRERLVCRCVFVSLCWCVVVS